MVLNYIFIAFFLIAFVIGIIRVLAYYNRQWIGDVFSIEISDKNPEVFTSMVQKTFDMAETSVDIAIYLIGVMSLWLGIMKIGEKGGAIELLSKLAAPFFQKLFPDLPKNHPAGGSMIMNFSANMLGLDNAATPLGLRAMEDLQKENPDKERASNAQIMFLVLNTSGLTLIPVSVLGLRAAEGASNPADVFLPILITTYFSTLAGLISVAIAQKINLLNKVVIAYLGIATLIIIAIIFYFMQLPQDQVGTISSFAGNFILFSIIVSFILLAVRKKVNIYESFIEGAKEGFQVAVKIIPYLVAILVAIGVFRASGAMEWLTSAIGYIVGLAGLNTDFVGALPTAFMKPLSGSGARGMMVDAMNQYGPDSFVGKLASTFQGSTETTFYVLAVYFGSVGIRNTRYAVTCGLIADFAGIIAGIFIAYVFFH